MVAMSFKEHPPHHVPVLLDASLELLQPQSGESYLDLTAGYGGHAAAFLSRTDNFSDACFVDRDDLAIRHLETFKERGVRIEHTDFVTAARRLIDEGKTFDIVLADLGVSSPQLDIAERGFSFTHPGPLDMRMDQRQPITAADYITSATVESLTRDIIVYGEEPRAVAKRYAQSIIAHRPYQSTKELAEVIVESHRGRWQHTHPATRTFQAIRIAINDELRQVETLLPLLPKLLNKNGRVGIISFHSLEDRLVKRYFNEQRDAGYEAELEILTKQPRHGTEDVHNPRARSAKLRVAVKK